VRGKGGVEVGYSETVSWVGLLLLLLLLLLESYE
jgi:hypothetical protein